MSSCNLVFAGESGGNTDGQTVVTEGSKTEVGKTSSKSATKSAASIGKKSTEKVTEPGSDLHKTASGDSASQEKAASQAADGEDGTERSERCVLHCCSVPDCVIRISFVSAEAEKTMDDDQASEATKGPRYGVNETPVSKANTTTSSKGSKQTKKSKKSEKEKEKEEERVKSAAKPQVERSSVVHVTRTCCEH